MGIWKYMKVNTTEICFSLSLLPSPSPSLLSVFISQIFFIFFLLPTFLWHWSRFREDGLSHLTSYFSSSFFLLLLLHHKWQMVQLFFNEFCTTFFIDCAFWASHLCYERTKSINNSVMLSFSSRNRDPLPLQPLVECLPHTHTHLPLVNNFQLNLFLWWDKSTWNEDGYEKITVSYDEF